MPGESAVAQSSRRLTTWRQIGDFLGKDERTAKRWEATRAMPVHRVPGGGNAAVYAFTDELERWMSAGRAAAPGEAPVAVETLESPGSTATSASEASEVAAAKSRTTRWALPAALALLLTAAVAGGLWWSAARAPKAAAHAPAAVALVKAASLQIGRNTPDGARRAIDLLTQSTRLDPGYGEAFALLASAYVQAAQLVGDLPANRAYPRALTAAERAIELDPTSADAHASLGFLEFYWNRNFAAGLRHFREVVRLVPARGAGRAQLGQALLILGDTGNALKEITAASQLEPDSPSYAASFAFARYVAGDRSAGVAGLREVIADKPTEVMAHQYLLVIAMAEHDWVVALREGATVARLRGDSRRIKAFADADAALKRGGPPAMLDAMLRYARAEAEAGREPWYAVALFEALKGDAAGAFTALERSMTAREPNALEMRVDPILAPLRGDPRFEQLARQSGLVAPGGR